MGQTLQSVLCITINKYLVRVLVVLLHGRFSVVGPIPFLLAAIFFPGHPYVYIEVLPYFPIECCYPRPEDRTTSGYHMPPRTSELAW